MPHRGGHGGRRHGFHGGRRRHHHGGHFAHGAWFGPAVWGYGVDFPYAYAEVAADPCILVTPDLCIPVRVLGATDESEIVGFNTLTDYEKKIYRLGDENEKAAIEASLKSGNQFAVQGVIKSIERRLGGGAKDEPIDVSSAESTWEPGPTGPATPWSFDTPPKDVGWIVQAQQQQQLAAASQAAPTKVDGKGLLLAGALAGGLYFLLKDA